MTAQDRLVDKLIDEYRPALSESKWIHQRAIFLEKLAGLERRKQKTNFPDSYRSLTVKNENPSRGVYGLAQQQNETLKNLSDFETQFSRLGREPRIVKIEKSPRLGVSEVKLTSKRLQDLTNEITAAVQQLEDTYINCIDRSSNKIQRPAVVLNPLQDNRKPEPENKQRESTVVDKMESLRRQIEKQMLVSENLLNRIDNRVKTYQGKQYDDNEDDVPDYLEVGPLSKSDRNSLRQAFNEIEKGRPIRARPSSKTKAQESETEYDFFANLDRSQKEETAAEPQRRSREPIPTVETQIAAVKKTKSSSSLFSSKSNLDSIAESFVSEPALGKMRKKKTSSRSKSLGDHIDEKPKSKKKKQKSVEDVATDSILSDIPPLAQRVRVRTVSSTSFKPEIINVDRGEINKLLAPQGNTALKPSISFDKIDATIPIAHGSVRRSVQFQREETIVRKLIPRSEESASENHMSESSVLDVDLSNNSFDVEPEVDKIRNGPAIVSRAQEATEDTVSDWDLDSGSKKNETRTTTPCPAPPLKSIKNPESPPFEDLRPVNALLLAMAPSPRVNSQSKELSETAKFPELKQRHSIGSLPSNVQLSTTFRELFESNETIDGAEWTSKRVIASTADDCFGEPLGRSHLKALRDIVESPASLGQSEYSEEERYAILRALIAHRDSRKDELTTLKTNFDVNCSVEKRKEIHKIALQGKNLYNVSVGECGIAILSLCKDYPYGLFPVDFYRHFVDLKGFELDPSIIYTKLKAESVGFLNAIINHFSDILQSITISTFLETQVTLQSRIRSSDIAHVLGSIMMPKASCYNYKKQRALETIMKLKHCRKGSKDIKNDFLELLFRADGILLWAVAGLKNPSWEPVRNLLGLFSKRLRVMDCVREVALMEVKTRRGSAFVTDNFANAVISLFCMTEGKEYLENLLHPLVMTVAQHKESDAFEINLEIPSQTPKKILKAHMSNITGLVNTLLDLLIMTLHAKLPPNIISLLHFVSEISSPQEAFRLFILRFVAFALENPGEFEYPKDPKCFRATRTLAYVSAILRACVGEELPPNLSTYKKHVNSHKARTSSLKNYMQRLLTRPVEAVEPTYEMKEDQVLQEYVLFKESYIQTGIIEQVRNSKEKKTQMVKFVEALLFRKCFMSKKPKSPFAEIFT